MRIFVTGASGWIGSAAIPELLAAGHEVIGLARSESAATAVQALGAGILPGSLDDLDALRTGAKDSDGVIHLAFNHDFTDYVGAGRTERRAVETFLAELEGTDRPLLVASGLANVTPGRVTTEKDRPTLNGPDSPRGGTEGLALEAAGRGVRSVALRFAASVHGNGDHGFVAQLIKVARERGVSGYIGDGSSRWPAVHRSDAGIVITRALNRAPAGSIVHAVAEEGITSREIAEAIGRQLDLPTRSIDPAEADDHFGWIGRFFALDIAASSQETQRLLDWSPAGPTLSEDLDAGAYTDAVAG